MYKRRSQQLSLLEDAEMFGGLKLSPRNRWVRLSKIVPWAEFEERYAEHFSKRTGQIAIPARMALGALLIKERYHGMSDEDLVEEIAMNPYLQYFLGMPEYNEICPFASTMFVRFRKRVTPEMLSWVNDRICERPEEKPDDQDHGDNDSSDGSGHKNEPEGGCKESQAEQLTMGTLILDATCAPQNIRFPQDASLLDEARRNLEQIIDVMHDNGMTDGQKPRTYREQAKNEYNSYSKKRRKKYKDHRNAVKAQLQYVRRDLGYIDSILVHHPDCLTLLPIWLQERLSLIRTLYAQQQGMYDNKVHSCPDRIISLSQPWIRPIVRGKLNAATEFGAKIEMSVVNGFLRIEHLSWSSFNESTTLQASVESYRRAYGHYPARILADTIFRTRENLRYCKEHGIHMSGPKFGKRPSDEKVYREQLRQEWLESGERGEIERDFGVAKRRYSLGRIFTKLKETSETTIHLAVLSLNLWKKLRLLLHTLLQWWLACCADFSFAEL